jgi:hypothetical protein
MLFIFYYHVDSIFLLQEIKRSRPVTSINSNKGDTKNISKCFTFVMMSKLSRLLGNLGLTPI